MEILVKELHSRGHNMTVIRVSESWFVRERSPHYHPVTIHLGEEGLGMELFDDSARRILDARRQGAVVGSLVQVRELLTILSAAHSATSNMLSKMLENQDLMAQLKDTGYDLMLTDPAMPAGVILAHYLHLPLVYNVRWMSFGEGHFSIAPSPVSYVPVPGSGLTDQMDVLQRTRNLLHYTLNFLLERLLVFPTYSPILEKHFPPGADLLTMQYSADVWLMRMDFIFEFPRPTMPNLVYIGGFQCRPAKALPKELEDFVQSSGEHGVVVMTLGSLISALPREVTEAVAAAFARLPHKVVWKFTGDRRPSSLGNNTLLLDWLPQNDLLGHPKTRAFVAHGGTNGLYEAIYHGVPVLGLPLLFDQPDNLLRLQARGAVRVLEPATLTEEAFLEALRDVLNDPSYRRSMQGLSSLHRDQPQPPLQRAVFWVEYVIRNQGAGHLRTEAYSMGWACYYSLDMLALLLALPLVPLGALVSLLRLRRSRGSKVTTAPNEEKKKTVNALKTETKGGGKSGQADTKKNR
ncbi:UDP glucuronosyltransferase 5 family, polypeptide G2 [Osmerus mordax]|uniref:UDP glucuronosyltransferase 5 family, polypeptide G2 n=1 Tax=Osmerus mordax TaxID=8014 RepID=UPI0035106742